MSEDLTTGGRVRPITRWGTPVMHETTKPVTEFGDELHDLVRDMFATMRAAEGVGLAATQVGVGVSVFVYECPDANDRIQRGVVCNPAVDLPQGKDRNLDAAEEGCLSWPGGYSSVPRPDKAVCRGRMPRAGRSNWSGQACWRAVSSTRRTISMAWFSGIASRIAPAGSWMSR